MKMYSYIVDDVNMYIINHSKKQNDNLIGKFTEF